LAIAGRVKARAATPARIHPLKRFIVFSEPPVFRSHAEDTLLCHFPQTFLNVA
jgi:hypothetical protein